MLIENGINYFEEQNFDVEWSREMHEQYIFRSDKNELGGKSMEEFTRTGA